MNKMRVIVAACALGVSSAGAQTTMLPSITETLSGPAPAPAITEYQLQQYLMDRIPALPQPATAQQWTAEEARLRDHILNDVVFHGWPRAWVDAPPHFEPMGVVETGHGYRIRKYRYEIVPSFMSTALLYEPENLSGRAPAVLNLLGHEPDGIAVEYEQKRCINLARRGIVALSLSWMAFGDLAQPENAHDYAAGLNLVGSNAAGLFYLSMRRGLDFLAASTEVDPSRIGVTGLSGGGWQTVVLSALDPRVAVSVEVAGVGSRESNLTHPRDTDEIEEDAPDLMRGFDYPEFIAMRAPRPTLLVHNAVDSCCFRAPLVKPYLYDNVKPFFAKYGAADNLAWHMNFDPGVHNYQLDNRTQAYRFFTEHFHMPVAESEIFSDAEIHSAQELAVGVPAGNQTVLGLARSFAGQIHRDPIPADGAERARWTQTQRELLTSVVRYHKVSVVRALRTANSKGMDFQSLSYRFDQSNGISAYATWFKEDHSPAAEPVTVVLNDDGYKAAGQQVYDSLSSGHDVLALDLLFTGATRPDVSDSADWALLVSSSGERCLGLEAAQLLAIVQWLHSEGGAADVQVQTRGIRSQAVALIAAALDPAAFSSLTTEGGMHSLSWLLEKPVPFRAAPDLFCLDLYKDFDIDSLSALAAPLKITRNGVAGQ